MDMDTDTDRHETRQFLKKTIHRHGSIYCIYLNIIGSFTYYTLIYLFILYIIVSITINEINYRPKENYN